MPSVSAWLCTWLCTVSGESCVCVSTHDSAWERHEDCRLCAHLQCWRHWPKHP